jgi:DNA-binding response OmpR family regulator
MSYRVLVVEDEFTFRLALETHIERTVQGAEVSFLTGDPDEAETYLRSAPKLDLAIVDLQLPGGNGFDPDGGFRIVKSLHAVDANVPVIVLTIRNDGDAVTQARNHPSIRYLVTKPWNPEQLTTFIGNCLSGPRASLIVVGLPGGSPG